MTRSTLALVACALLACNKGAGSGGVAMAPDGGRPAPTPMPTLAPTTTTTASPPTQTSEEPTVSPTAPTRNSPTIPTTAAPPPPPPPVATAISTEPRPSPSAPTRNSPTAPSLPPTAVASSLSPEELPAGPQFRACDDDSECVAVPLAACCPHGTLEAVNTSKEDAYRASFHCPTVQPMCPLWMRKDPRVARCDVGTKLCTMVGP